MDSILSGCGVYDMGKQVSIDRSSSRSNVSLAFLTAGIQD